MTHKKYGDEGVIVYNKMPNGEGTVYFKKEDFVFTLKNNMFRSRNLDSVLSYSYFLKKDCFISDNFIVVMPGEMI